MALWYLFLITIQICLCSSLNKAPDEHLVSAFDPIAISANPSEYKSGVDNQLLIKNIDFGKNGASEWKINLKNLSEDSNGWIRLRLDHRESQPVSSILLKHGRDVIDNAITAPIVSPVGVHDLYISIPSGLPVDNVESFTFTRKAHYNLEPRLDQWYYVVNVESGRALETPNNRVYGPMTQWYFQGSETQRYRFEKLENGSYKIVANVTGGILEVKDLKFDQSRVETEDFKNTRNQQWQLSVHTSGAFSIHPMASAACLTVASSEPGIAVVVNDCKGDYYLLELWFLVPACEETKSST